MNKLNKVLLMLILLLSFSYVKADCSEEELTKLKEETDKIEITYKHLDDYYNDEGKSYYYFEVNIKNINDDFYIKINDDEIYNPQDNKISKILYYGNWDVRIYSNKCDKEIDSIKIKLPKFNVYSLDPLCEGIDGEKFSLCGKYYNYDISYDDFKKRVEHYRTTYRIEKTEIKKTEEKEKTNFVDKIKKELEKNKKIIIIVISVIIAIMIAVMIINKKRKRGVLK